MEQGCGLRIRLLGDLALLDGGGQPARLPASKKARALIGYLVATGEPHRRERLCDLLWEGPNDPRAELRWSLNKIRPLLNEGDTARLVADRERIGFTPRDVEIDLATIRRLVTDRVATASTEALRMAAGLFRGEFLDGLDLPACYRFQEWCMAEREAVSRLRLAVLGGLVERLAERPDESLPFARALVAVDPLAEHGHAAVVRLLGTLGRKKEALAHYQHARRVIEDELGVAPADELEAARRALGASVPRRSPAVAASDPQLAAAEPAPDGRPMGGPFVGRHAERDLLDRLVSTATAGLASGVLLVTGEPGIGKSHLLERLGERMAASGGATFSARAFEAEAGRAYGIWTDILRTIARGRGSDGSLRELAPLLPEQGAAAADPADRARLFDGVVGLLDRMAAEKPLIIALDDLQWLDDASASLLHFVARTRPSRLLLACAARAGEIDDNAAASGVLRSLARDGRLHEVALAPLSMAETAELARTVDARLDPASLYAESEGNPLFVLELARSRARGGEGAGQPLAIVIAGQLAQLEERTRELLMWAAALGRSFTPGTLAQAAGFELSELLAALDELERRRVVRPVGDDTYDFVHDLVRQASYRAISQPRRKLIHRQITRALTKLVEQDHALAGELARHAALCDDHEAAAGACVLAGERCLRLFANAQASAFAERGLRHLDRLPQGPFRVATLIALDKVRILAATGPGMRPLPPLATELTEAAAAAEALGLSAAAATGHYLLSVLHQAAGDSRQAQESSLRAAQAGRATDQTTYARQLANTARCLLELETEVARSRTLIREAEAHADMRRLDICELHWGRGLLCRWDGDADTAARSLEHALELAREEEDRWREYKCLTWLAMIELERGRSAATRVLCAELMQVAGKLGEADIPFVVTLNALARLTEGDAKAPDRLADAVGQLRAVDDKSYLAYALNVAGLFHLRNAKVGAAHACATEALTAAETMRRSNEIVIARSVLARIDIDRERSAAVEDINEMLQQYADPDSIGMRARAVLLEAAQAVRSQFQR